MLGPMWIICVHWLCSVFHYMRTTHVNNNVTMPIENIGLMKNGKWSKGHNMSNVLCTKKFFIFPQSVNKTTKIKTLLLLESAQKHSLASQYFEMENWIKAICGINHKGRLGAPRSLSPWKAKIFPSSLTSCSWNVDFPIRTNRKTWRVQYELNSQQTKTSSLHIVHYMNIFLE